MLIVSCLLLGCSPGDGSRNADQAAPSPNLVLISIDTLRADHLSAYGYPRETSPSFDRFAGQGLRFENAFSPTSWTLPGHASMLTGLNPLRHGAVAINRTIRADAATLAERLTDAGYTAEALVNGIFVKAAYGFDRGFDSFGFFPLEESDAHHAAALALVRSRDERPFFLFLHYMRVHAPYRRPASGNPFERPYDGDTNFSFPALLKAREERGGEGPLVGPAALAYMIDLYDGGILAMDQLLGELLGTLDEPGLENTVVIVTSDHGEEFLEHGLLGHSFTLYEEVIRVPLAIRGPGLPAGRRVAAVAGLVDIVPTALDLLGLGVPEGLDGRSLRSSWEEAEEVKDGQPTAAEQQRTLVLRSGFPMSKARRVGLRTLHEKLILDPDSGELEYYDLARDPTERNALPATGRGAELKRQLESLTEASSAGRVTLSENELERLEALGYAEPRAQNSPR